MATSTTTDSGSQPDPIYRPRVRHALDGWLLTITAVISVLVHVAIAIQFASEPIGYLPRAWFEGDAVIPVKLAEPTEIDLPDPAATSEGDADEPADLADLSEALLSDPHVAEPDDPTESTISDDVDLRSSPEDRPMMDTRAWAAGTPQISFPQEVDQALLGDLDLSLQFSGAGGSSTGGPDEGGNGGARRSATDMLRGQRLVVGAAPTAPIAAPPRVDEGPGRVTAQDFLDLEPTRASIDFTEIDIDSIAELRIPEKLDNDFEYVVTRFTPPPRSAGFFGLGEAVESEFSFFRVDITAKRSLRKLQTMPKDVVFLLDISGSVPQAWVDQAVAGVRDALGALNPGDRFNICLFSERPRFFNAQGVVTFDDATYRRALTFLTDQQAGGFTDVNAAMSRLLTRDLAQERVYNLVLISDGRPTKGVMDTRELINLATRDNDLIASIYCVGIGRRQNRELLEFLAYRNKGFCVFVDREADAASSIRDLMSRLRYPILKNLEFSVAGIQDSEIYPLNLPNVHQGETFTVFGRYRNPNAFTMRLMGHNGPELFDFTFSRDLREAEVGGNPIEQGWALWKLHHLYSEVLRRGEQKSILDQIETLRKAYDLKTLY